MSCSRSQEFLAKKKIDVGERVIANKVKLGRDEALALARQADQVIAAKGKKVVRFRRADRPSDDELAAAILGPSGNLRAPAIRVGKTLLVGFHPDVYAETFG
jgi:arsenate reductase-like glutaredoxin family protein